MIALEQKQSCCGCRACAQICPKGCITMQPDEEGFLYPAIDKAACIQCGLCEKACPVLHNSEEKKDDPTAYAAYCLDEAVRMASSSGGIFTLLAEYVLTQNGAVYGAAMDNSYVKHIRIAAVEELPLLQGSKYVQSDIGNTFIEAKQDLDAQRLVLFTGTPCQIEGLKAFLRKEYDNLICMDIVCHGVPSPMVWEKYVALREKTAGNPAVRMSFRHKVYGWKTFSVLFEFSNKTEYVCKHREDLFMRAFLQNLCLRPACYQCSFKKVNRVSDITVADFWGIDKVCPEMDDDKGTSLVIVHSEKGNTVFAEICRKMRFQKVDFCEAVKGNPPIVKSVEKPKTRDVFMQRIHTEPFENVVQQYAKERKTIKRRIKQILKRLGLLDLAKNVRKR